MEEPVLEPEMVPGTIPQRKRCQGKRCQGQFEHIGNGARDNSGGETRGDGHFWRI
jgi:hypothetical protein